MRIIPFTLIVLLALSGAQAAELKADKDRRAVMVPAKIAPRKISTLDEVYPIEVIATAPHPRGQKAHETVVVTDVKPSEVHKALESLGLKSGKPARGEDARAEGPLVSIHLEFAAEDGPKRVPIERTLVDKKTGKTLPALNWRFTGSALKQTDPAKPDKTYGADVTGTLIGIFPVTDETVIQTDLTLKDEPLIKLETNTKVLPPEGSPVTLIIEVKR
jgi:hypothetical protein